MLSDFTGDAAVIYLIIYNNERLLCLIFVRMFWRLSGKIRPDMSHLNHTHARTHRHGALSRGFYCPDKTCGESCVSSF